MGKWKHSKENGLAQGHIDLESRPLASQLKALSPETHRGRGREKDGGQAPVGPSPHTPSRGPQRSHSPASPGGRYLPDARACQDAPAGKERAQSRSLPPHTRPPTPPAPKTWARSSPSLPAAPGALSRPLDSWLDTGKEIPQGSVVTGQPQANWAVLPHLARSDPPSHRTWLHLSAAAPPHLPLTLPPEGTYLLARPSQDDPPLPRISPAPAPPPQPPRPLTRKSALPSRP